MSFHKWAFEQKWHIGSEHGNLDKPEYRYDLTGFPFFIGINEKRISHTDYHIAIGIQTLDAALEIVNLHNANL